jgi:opacity protein-like surface antigen
MLGLFCLSSAVPSNAEWYVAGYGGLSTEAKLTDVTMPVHGQRVAMDQFSGTKIPTTGDTVTQNFKTSDLSLKNSLIFGAKAGFFLDDPSLKWLGFELESFTTKPNIKQQTLQTNQDITYSPGSLDNCQDFTTDCPETRVLNGQLSVMESSLRVTAIVLNVIARYPGTTFQPYVGIGGGGFYFSSSGQIDGRQVVPGLNAQLGLKVLATEEWALFVEGKYNYATITNLDPVGFGLSGAYSAFNTIAGVAYHF